VPTTHTRVPVDGLQVALARDALLREQPPEEQHVMNVDLRAGEALSWKLGERHRVHRIVQGFVDREPTFSWYIATSRGDGQDLQEASS
jgi:hypothetical protein